MYSLSPIVRDFYVDLCSLPPEVHSGFAFATVPERLERLTEVLREEAAFGGRDLFEHPYLVGPGAPLADLIRVFAPEVRDDERLAAVRRLDGQVTGLLANPEARGAFYQRAEERDQSPEDLRQELLLEGILLAAEHGDRPQRLRLGRTWLKTKDGTVSELVPDDLTFGLELQVAWLIKEARNDVEAILLDREYPPSENEKDLKKNTSWRQEYIAEQRDQGRGESPEKTPTPAETVSTLRSIASQREREYMDLLAEDHKMTNKEAARRLGVRPGTISAMKARLKKKAKRASAEPL